MQIMYYVAELAASMIDAVLMMYCLAQFFGKKKENSIIFDIVIVLILFAISQGVSHNLTLQIVLLIATMLMYCVIALNGTRVNQILITVSIIIGIAVVNMIVMQIEVLITGSEVAKLIMMGSVERIIYCCISKSLLFFIIYVVIHWYGASIRLKGNEWGLVITYFCSTMIISLFLINVVVLVPMSNVEKIKMLIVTILLAAITIISFGLVSKMNKKNKLEVVNKMLELQLVEQKQSIIKVNKAYEETRKLKHDLNRQLAGILELIKGDRTDDAKTYIEKLINKKTVDHVIFINNNNIINSVINEKLTVCRETGIEFNLEVTSAIAEPLELEVAVLLSNLLDNAIEAEMKLESGRTIDLKIFEYKEKYNTIIRNKIESSVLENNPDLVTDKTDKNNHGLGLMSVYDTVAKYDGTFEKYERNNKFVVHVIIPNM